MLFTIGFGSERREARIREIVNEDATTAVILAAVHFEWMLKRAILKLGISPTTQLRTLLEDVYRLDARPGTTKKANYKDVWAREVGTRFPNGSLGVVIGNLHRLQARSMKVRGRIIHGNGVVSHADAVDAVEQFLSAGEKLRLFAIRHGESLDERLRARLRSRA